MGGGIWNKEAFASVASSRTKKSRSEIFTAKTIDVEMDPVKFTMRESRDSDEHPNSVPIMIWLDETGSMGSIPEQMVKKDLAGLMDLLNEKKYVDDPQLCFCGIGDAYSDRHPVQVGQFESDNRCDDWLTKIYLEGGGGGGMKESYELALYTAARYVVADAWERRGRKGYLFIIGDEAPYDYISKKQVKSIFGDSIQADIPVEDMLEEVQEHFHVIRLHVPYGHRRLPNQHDERIFKRWQDLLGQNAIRLDDPKDISAMIGVTIGMIEGSTDLDKAASDMSDAGIDDIVADRVTTALVPFATENGIVPKGPSNTSVLPPKKRYRSRFRQA